ncbi:glycosyltransferase family 4 protein [Psychroserpens sp. MEBiC05023]
MIIINARFLTQRITGVQRFALELSKRIKSHYKHNVEFVTHSGIIHKDLAKELDAKIIGINKSHLWEQFDLYFYLLKKNKPLLITFGYTGPLFYRNQIISIHDIAFRHYRKSFSRSFSFVYNFLVPKLARKGLHVLTVSKASKKEIHEELGISKEKITVIYNGLSSIFKTKTKEFLEENEKYILTVSSHHPRKNFNRLIEAFSQINNDSLKLYIIGNKVKHFKNENKNAIKIDNRVRFLSDISDEQLVTYYDNALLFVFPSIYEGFGIPIIEAMSRGLTCVISDIPVFKEIGNEKMVYINPYKTNSIKQGIEKGIEESETKKLYNIQDFSWSKSANKVIELIEEYTNN